MIRLLLFTLLLGMPLLSVTSALDKKINTTAKQIKNFDKEHSTIHQKMAQNAKAILRQKNNILKQQKRIDILARELKFKEEHYTSNKKELAKHQ